MVPLSGGSAIPLDPVLPLPELPLVPLFDPVVPTLPELPDVPLLDPELPTTLPLLGPVVAVPLEPTPELPPPEPELLPEGAAVAAVAVVAGAALASSSAPGVDWLETFAFPWLGPTTVPSPPWAPPNGSVVPPHPTPTAGIAAKRIATQQVEVTRIGPLPS